MGLVIMSLAIIPLIVKYVDRGIKKIEIRSLIKKEFCRKYTRLTTLYFFIIVLNPSLILKNTIYPKKNRK